MGAETLDAGRSPARCSRSQMQPWGQEWTGALGPGARESRPGYAQGLPSSLRRYCGLRGRGTSAALSVP